MCKVFALASNCAICLHFFYNTSFIGVKATGENEKSTVQTAVENDEDLWED